LASVIGAQAQTNTTPTLGGLASTITGWIGNINTNYSYADVILWDGLIYENQLNVANELGGSYDLWHSVVVPNNSTGTLFDSVEGRFRQAGIAGVFASEQGGDEFGYMKGDFRIFGYVDGVFLQNPQVFSGSSHKGAWEVGLQAEKMFSQNMAGAIFIGMQEHQKYPLIGVNITVTFGTIGGLLKNIGL
jgi:hypothetical protein